MKEYRDKTKEKLPFLKKLQKQLLSKRSQSFIEAIKDEQHLKTALTSFFTVVEKKVAYLTTMLQNLKTYDPEQYQMIYLQREALEGFLYQFLTEVKPFEEAMYKHMKADKVSGINYNSKQNSYTFPKFIPLSYVKTTLEQYQRTEGVWKERYYKNEDGTGVLEPVATNLWEDFLILLQYELGLMLSRTVTNTQGESIEIGYAPAAQKMKGHVSAEQFSLSQQVQKDIKDYADIVRRIYIFGKSFALEESRDWDHNVELDSEFYMGEDGYLEAFYENAYEDIIKVYNQMRNFIAQKPRA